MLSGHGTKAGTGFSVRDILKMPSTSESETISTDERSFDIDRRGDGDSTKRENIFVDGGMFNQFLRILASVLQICKAKKSLSSEVCIFEQYSGRIQKPSIPASKRFLMTGLSREALFFDFFLEFLRIPVFGMCIGKRDVYSKESSVYVRGCLSIF